MGPSSMELGQPPTPLCLSSPVSLSPGHGSSAPASTTSLLEDNSQAAGTAAGLLLRSNQLRGGDLLARLRPPLHSTGQQTHTNSIHPGSTTLPPKGISKFYNGKSKSFASLGDASSISSIKDITKPENAYTRKRRNLMAFNHVWENKNRSFPLRSNGGGISKRPISSSRSTLALAVAMSSSESSSSTSDDSSSRSPPPLPPLHPQARASYNVKSPASPQRRHFCASRSLSLADLQQ